MEDLRKQVAAEKKSLRWLVITVVVVVAIFGVSRAYDWYEITHRTPEEWARIRKAKEYEREWAEGAEARELRAKQVREAREEQAKARKLEKQREEWEKECAEKGLRFVGTIGDNVECRP